MNWWTQQLVSEVDTKCGDCADSVAPDLQSDSELPQESGSCVVARYVLAQRRMRLRGPLKKDFCPGGDVKMSILDQSTLSEGFTAAEVIANTVALVKEVDRLGYHRIWLSEHHNMSILQESAPEVVLASVGTQTQRIRIGSGGVMLRNHSAYHVAEVFRMLVNIKNERRAIHSLKRSPFAPTTKAGRPC
jgi:hypothetical protein